VTRGACDGKSRRYEVGHDSRPTFSFYLQSYSSLSIITAQFRCFLSDAIRTAWTVASMRMDCLVKLASRGLKSERRILSGRAVHLLFFAIQALHAFVRFSQFALFSRRRKALFSFSLSLSLFLSFSSLLCRGESYFWRFLGGLLRRREARAAK